MSKEKLQGVTLKEYRNIHDWVRRRKKGYKCEFCEKTGIKLDNALKHGEEYSKNVNNYIKLCRKCHYHYDHPTGLKHSLKTKTKISESSKERIRINGVPDSFINCRKGVKHSQVSREKISSSKLGEKHPQSKLTEIEVRYIFNSIEHHSVLTSKFSVTYRTIYNIKSKKTWKHLNL